MIATTKICRSCGCCKPFDEFYRHPEMADGYFKDCKICQKTRVTKNRNANLERYRAYDRGRYRTNPKRQAQLKKLAEDAERDPIRRHCRITTSNAIRDGRLKRGPCEDCGTSKVEAHHEDYTKPFDVRWLCRRHHLQLHKLQLPD